MKRPCAVCDRDFEAVSPKQKTCSREHGQQLRRMQERKTNPRIPVPKTSGWRLRPTSDNPDRSLQQKLRSELLPRALGRLCPLCSRVMLANMALELDHITPRAEGGPTTRANCRIVHKQCNQVRGRQLGTAIRVRRHGH